MVETFGATSGCLAELWSWLFNSWGHFQGSCKPVIVSGGKGCLLKNSFLCKLWPFGFLGTKKHSGPSAIASILRAPLLMWFSRKCAMLCAANCSSVPAIGCLKQERSDKQERMHKKIHRHPIFVQRFLCTYVKRTSHPLLLATSAHVNRFWFNKPALSWFIDRNRNSIPIPVYPKTNVYSNLGLYS